MTAGAARKSLEPWLLDSVNFYPHQVDGIRQMLKMKSILLADDMGLGKSIQALTLFCTDVKTGQGDVLLVVCPVSVRTNWSLEIEKFTRIPHMLLGEEINNLTGASRSLPPGERTKQIVEFAMWSGPKILILNYEQVRPHLGELNALRARMLILDEAQYIKGHDSVRTKACLSIKAERSVLLTGTPVLNQVDDLWALLNRISPRNFPNYYAFVNRYCVFGGYKSKQIVGVKNEKELHRILDQVMIRRLKKDVLTIPEPRYIQVPVELHPLQRALYDEVDESMTLRNMDPNADDMEIQNALTKFLRLKQICGTPASVGHPDKSYKLDEVINKSRQVLLNDEKLVIFTQFRPVLASIESRLKAEGMPVVVLHGDVPRHERQEIVSNWSSFPAPIILLCMIQVAGIGLNMTKARTAFFVDKLFVPGLNQQAVDRLHRIGQQETQPIEVYEFIAQHTVEQRVEQILKLKKKIFDNVIEGTGVVRRLIEALRELE